MRSNQKHPAPEFGVDAHDVAYGKMKAIVDGAALLRREIGA